MTFPIPEPHGSSRHSEGPFNNPHADAHNFVAHVAAVVGVRPEWVQNREVSRALSEYCRVSVTREFGKSEQRLCVALASALAPPPVQNPDSISAYGRGLHQALTMVDRLMHISVSPQHLERIEKDCSAIANRPNTICIDIRRGLLQLTAGLTNINSWVGLLDACARITSGRVMSAAVDDTSAWNDRGPGAIEARAAFVQYLVGQGRPARRYKLETANARGDCPSEKGDIARASLLRIAAGQPPVLDSNQVHLILRAILSEERVRTSILPEFRETLKALEKNRAHATRFVEQLADLSVNQRREFVAYCGSLANAGYPSGLFFGDFPQFLSNERAYALDQHGTDIHVQRMAAGLAAFVDRLSSSSRHASATEIVKILGSTHGLPTFREPRNAEKLGLVLEARNLPTEDRGRLMGTMRQFTNITHELTAHSLIFTAVHTKDLAQREQADAAFASRDVAYADNPPFSVQSTPREEQFKFTRQLRHGFRRMFDGYLGFGAHTFPMRHTPISRRCFFDDFAWAAGNELKVVVAADFNRFPGRGRLVEGFNPSRIFASDPSDADRDPLRRWKKEILADLDPSARGVGPNFRHPLDDFRETRFVFLRGLKAVTVPGNDAWRIEGEHMTYVEYNHHFDSSGVHLALLVPTRALWSFIDPYTVKYKQDDSFPDGRIGMDICDKPPTVDALRQRCAEMRTRVGIINLGSGGCYGGGFCNGPDPRSPPFHTWETDKCSWWDGFGHAHKYNIQDDTGKLKRLYNLHQHAYALLVAGSSRLDLVKIAEHIYSWGQNYDLPPPDAAEAWRGEADSDLDDFGEYQDHVPFVMREVTDDSEFDLDPGTETGSSWQGRSTRMLEFAALWMAEVRQARIPEYQAPLLVLSPTMMHSRAPLTPFIFDTHSGIIWRRNQPALLFDDLDGSIPPEIEDWWISDVSSFAHRAPWVMPRLLSRDNYLDQLEAFKKK